MPRGKYIRKNKRNESALITRLMQISLKMDDHIYYGKHITPSQAGGFLQEIATLKLQCLPTNVRALQVIEKLTHCMKSIVTGEDSGHNSSLNTSNTNIINTQNAGSTSPVYSLPDEDKSIDIEEQNDVEMMKYTNDAEKVDKEMNLAHTSHEQHTVIPSEKQFDVIKPLQSQSNTSNPKNNLEDDKIIDLTIVSDTDETSNKLPVTNERNSAMGHINSGISMMTIDDVVLVSETRAKDVNSQSILDKYVDDIVDEEKLVERETHKVDAKAEVTKNVDKYLNTHTPLTDTSTQASAIEASKVINSQTKYENSQLVNPGKPVSEKKIKRSTKKREKEKDNKNASVNKSKSQPSIKLQQNIIAKVANTNSNGASSKVVKKPRKKLKNKVHEIYNNNVVNDLSWVENLRYVREISPEEQDPALSLLQDDFWDNFALPDTWNDSEFD